MLHEFERIALQKIALQKLNNSDLGVTTRIPKGEPAPAYSLNTQWPFFLNIVWKHIPNEEPLFDSKETSLGWNIFSFLRFFLSASLKSYGSS